MSIMYDIWYAIGAPSLISGIILPGAIGFLARYTKSKLKEISNLEDDVKLLKNDLKCLDRLITSRIDDIKDMYNIHQPQ